jgi:hypothetical protein
MLEFRVWVQTVGERMGFFLLAKKKKREKWAEIASSQLKSWLVQIV